METYYKSDFEIIDEIGVDLSALDFDIRYYTSGKKIYTVSKRGAVCLRCAVDVDDRRRLNVRFVGHGLRPGILSRELVFLDSGMGIPGGMAATKRQHVKDNDGEKVRLTYKTEPAASESGQDNTGTWNEMKEEIRQTQQKLENITTFVASLRAAVSTGSGNTGALLSRMTAVEGKASDNAGEITSLKTRMGSAEDLLSLCSNDLNELVGALLYMGQRMTSLENAVSGLTSRVNALEGHITGIAFANDITQITAAGSYDYSAAVTPADTTDSYTIDYDIESTTADSREESGSMVYLHYMSGETEVVLSFSRSTGEMTVPSGGDGYYDTVTVTATATVGGEVAATAEQVTEITIN